MQHLTEHFTLEEMIASTTADKYGIKNTPTKQQISELTRLCKDVLEPIRQKLGKPITITSGFRCKTLNHYIGGATTSQHMYGTAADIKCKQITVKELFDFISDMIKNNEIEVRQLIDEYNYSWVHISVNDKYHGYRKNQIIHLS